MRFGLAFGVLALAATAFGDSIVVNGDFATGDFTGWTTSSWGLRTGSGSPTTNFASEGCVGSFCSLDQLLTTNAGDTYTLEFAWSPDVFNTPAEGAAELVVLWDGSTTAIDLVVGSAPGPGQATPLDGFNTYTITGLVASTGATDLNFSAHQDPSWDGLTNVTVTDTSAPEPASYLMAAAGFLVLGASKLRARRR